MYWSSGNAAHPSAQRQLPRLLWIGGVGVLLSLALLLGLLLAHLRSGEIADARRELQSLAAVVSDLVTQYIDIHRIAVDAAARLASRYGADADTTAAALQELEVGAQALRRLSLMDSQGIPLAGHAPTDAISADVLARRTELLAQGHPALEPPRMSDGGEWLVRLVQPVEDVRIGWVAADISMDALDDLLADIDLGSEGNATLLHEAGLLVARQTESARFRGMDMRDLSVLDAARRHRSRGLVKTRRLDGVPRLVAYERVPEYDLVVAVGRSERSILAGWRQLLIVMACAFALVATLLLVAIGLVLRSWRNTVQLVTDLEVQEARLTEVQELGELGLLEYDAVSDRLLWSPAVNRLLDLSGDALQRGYRALMAALHDEDRDRVDRSVRHLQHAGGLLDVPCRAVMRDGSIRHLRLRVRSRTDPLGAAVITGALMDVTDATRARESLAVAEAQYRDLFESSPIAMWVYDIETLRFLAVNEAAVEMYGWSAGEFAGMTLRDIRPSEDLPRLQDALTSGTEFGNGQIWRHCTRDGRLIHARVYGSPAIFRGRPARLVAALDFTDKVRAEQELADSEARFRLVARASNDAIYEHDVARQSIWWSDSYYHHFGNDPAVDESHIDRWLARVHPDEREAVSLSLDRALAGTATEWEGHYRYLRHDGAYAHVHDRGFILRDDDGKPLRIVGGMLDRTPELTARQAVIERENTYRGLVEGLPLPLLVIRDGSIVFANAAAVAALAPDGATLVGRPAAMLFEAPGLALGSGADLPRRARQQVRVRRAHGEAFLAEATLSDYRDAAGAGVQVMLRDLTEQVRFERQLTHQARHDELTGLPNRRALRELLRARLGAGSNAPEVAAVFVDLDQFKLINDALGHAVGDTVVRAVADRLRQAVSADVFLCRFGGDEFMLVVDADAADALVRRVHESLAEPLQVLGTTQFLSASIGLAIGPRDGTDADTLIRSADSAMYEAKRQGRNRAVMYSEALHRSASNRLELMSRLRRSDLDHELALYFQTQHRAGDGAIIGMELLLRWPGGPPALRQPDRFIPICEEIGLMVPIGRWVIREACRRQRDAAAIAGRPCRIAVNVSAQQFVHDDLVSTVTDILAETGADGSLLELEITESALLADPGGLVQTIERLRQLGVEVTIDDFGSGYSNLGYLSRLPVTRLKIDRSFVRDLDERQNGAICRSIISLAHSLSMRVVAEGVETEAQRDWLVRNGCDELQGYLFSRPKPFPGDLDPAGIMAPPRDEA